MSRKRGVGNDDVRKGVGCDELEQRLGIGQ